MFRTLVVTVALNECATKFTVCGGKKLPPLFSSAECTSLQFRSIFELFRSSKEEISLLIDPGQIAWGVDKMLFGGVLYDCRISLIQTVIFSHVKAAEKSLSYAFLKCLRQIDFAFTEKRAL